METRTAVLMGLIKKHVAGDLVYAYSDYNPIDAQHSLQIDMLYVSDFIISAHGPSGGPMSRSESILIADLVSGRIEGIRAQQI